MPDYFWNARHRAAYLAANGAVFALIYEQPRTCLWVQTWDEASGAVDGASSSTILGTFAFLVLLAWIPYFVVQGSDPGFLSAAVLDTGRQGRGLLSAAASGSAATGASGSGSGSNGRGGAAASGGGFPDDDDDFDTGADLHHASVELEVVASPAAAAAAPPAGRGSAQPAAAAAAGELGEADDVESGQAPLPATAGGSAGEVVGGGSVASFCAECSIDRPLRAVHCRVCRKCVSTFDHHCGALGTCVGEKNHCKFWWFLLAQFVALLYAVSIVHTGFWWDAGGGRSWLGANGYGLFAAFVVWSLFLNVSVLFGWHSFMACTNTTAHEFGRTASLPYLRGTRECDLPYSNGCHRNVFNFCCVRDGCAASLRLKSVWRPTLWPMPRPIDRNAELSCDSLWENRYWSCLG